MAYVAAREGDRDPALDFLVKATRAPGAAATAWYYLGMAYRQGWASGQAVEPLLRAVALDASLFPAVHDLGLCQLELLQLPLALRSFETALALQPSSLEALHNKGRTLHALGRLEEALQCFD